MSEGRKLRVAYVNYGEQSGVTAHVLAALAAAGHEVLPVFGRGPLELRDPITRRPRVTVPVVKSLAVATARFGRRALSYRWNTGYAFDVHTRWAGERLRALVPAPDVVLQNGALFAPGAPPPWPYVLYVDYTRALAERSAGARGLGFATPPPWGSAWRQREGAAYRGAATVAAFSANTAHSLVADYGVSPERVRVVGAGANVLPAAVARRDDGETIVFVGREFERKGGRVLLEAFWRVRRRRPRARLLLAGPVRPLALPNGAVQLGPLPLDDIPALMSEATVFALPVLQEPFGIAFLDAMACGVPCVGCALDAVPEIVEDGRTGLLVAPGDVAGLERALLRVLGNPDEARAMGARARARVEAHFTWGLVAERLSGLLALASRGVASSPDPVWRGQA